MLWFQINEFTATRWQRLTYSTSPLSPYNYEGLGDGVLSQYGELLELQLVPLRLPCMRRG